MAGEGDSVADPPRLFPVMRPGPENKYYQLVVMYRIDDLVLETQANRGAPFQLSHERFTRAWIDREAMPENVFQFVPELWRIFFDVLGRLSRELYPTGHCSSPKTSSKESVSPDSASLRAIWKFSRNPSDDKSSRVPGCSRTHPET